MTQVVRADPVELAEPPALGPLVLFGPPALLLGVAFRALQEAIHDDVRSSGLRVGRGMAANTAGNRRPDTP